MKEGKFFYVISLVLSIVVIFWGFKLNLLEETLNFNHVKSLQNDINLMNETTFGELASKANFCLECLSTSKYTYECINASVSLFTSYAYQGELISSGYNKGCTLVNITLYSYEECPLKGYVKSWIIKSGAHAIC